MQHYHFTLSGLNEVARRLHMTSFIILTLACVCTCCDAAGEEKADEANNTTGCLGFIGGICILLSPIAGMHPSAVLSALLPLQFLLFVQVIRRITNRSHAFVCSTKIKLSHAKCGPIL